MPNILNSLSKNVISVLNILVKKKYQAYIVGGAVRDALLSRHIHDYDITTNALPNEIKKIYLENDYNVIETGIKHGTITVIKNNVSYEITTFRIDGNYMDNRHPDNVIFTNNLMEDLKRRDFTINALACDIYGNIIDYNNGLNDLKCKVIRTVGNPIERFTEDALRIMRAIRFSAVLNFKIEENTNKAILDLSHLIKSVSIERINSEMEIILSHSFKDIFIKYNELFKNAYNYNVNLSEKQIEKIDLFPFYSMKIAYLFSYLNEEDFFYYINNFKFNNNFKRIQKMFYKNRLHLNEKNISDYEIKKYLSMFGLDEGYLLIQYICYFNNIDLLVTKYRIEKLSSSICDIKSLCINGNDLIELGYNGTEIGIILNDVVNTILIGKVKNDKSTIMKYIKKVYKKSSDKVD